MYRMVYSQDFIRFGEDTPYYYLPKTFAEAVIITARLGFGYLWIDTLCIPQNSEDDWLHESAQMACIDANSYLNLAATASGDALGYLFVDGSFDPRHSCILEVPRHQSQRQTTYCRMILIPVCENPRSSSS
jgi:hypothetical protein